MTNQPSHKIAIWVFNACTLFVATMTLAATPPQANTGSGNPLFLPVVTYDTGGTGYFDTRVRNSLAIADVNRDGVLDLVAANWCTSVSDCSHGSVGVLLGNGDGTFKPAVTYSSGGYQAFAVLVSDVDADGKSDLILANGCPPPNGRLAGQWRWDVQGGAQLPHWPIDIRDSSSRFKRGRQVRRDRRGLPRGRRDMLQLRRGGCCPPR
jgi:FG-GAP-like repeat